MTAATAQASDQHTAHGSYPFFVGIDPSLTGTGLARIHGITNETATSTIRTRLTGHDRLAHILRTVKAATCCASLVVIEGPAYGSQANRQAGHHERAGLWWLITHELWDEGIPFAVAPPNQRAKYATGKAGASKDQVLAATVRRFGDLAEVEDNNQADALILALMGVHHYRGLPLVEVPTLHAEALSKTVWPAVTS